MSEYRRFDAAAEDLAARWSQLVMTADEWVVDKPVGWGEAQSLFVDSVKDGLRGVAKPAHGGEIPRAAHEKIAADLALLAGAPVPPVCLWKDRNGQLFSISAFVFKQSETIGNMKSQLSPAFLDNLASQFARGLVFHTWIADGDHGGNEGNVIVDGNSDDTAPAIALIDHAYSMSYQWAPGSPCVPITSYYRGISDLPKVAVEESIKAVQVISEVTIRELVGRIPGEFLSPDRADTVAKCLLERQAQLAQAFGV